MSIVGDILKAAIERSHKVQDDQAQHIKEQGEAIAESARKPLWLHRMEQLKAALNINKPTEAEPQAGEQHGGE